MIRVLLITKEERLKNILRPIFDQSNVSFETAEEWSKGQELLFRERYDLVALDYEALKLEALDTFVTLDNIFAKEQSVGVLMVRSKSARTEQLEEQFTAIHEVVDMSAGKPVFLRRMTLAFGEARRAAQSRLSSSTLETDAIAQVEIDLPVRSSGDLANIQLARLAYTLRIRKESGRLKLTSGKTNRVFGFSQGQVVTDDDSLEMAESFPEMFAWTTGTYEFVADDQVTGDTIETVDLILRGIQKYKHQRDLTEALIESMKTVPIRTNLWEEREERFSNYGALRALIRHCDGTATLEQALAQLGSMVNEGFRAAYFALQTDLLIPQPETHANAGVVMYSREVRQRRQKIADSERKETKAFKAAESESGRVEVEAELSRRAEEFERASAHEIFGVWEGCGKEVVQETFYRMVKEHHPDVYGGNISPDMKKLAQEIFIAVKDAYQKLLKEEREQTVPPPESFKKKEREFEAKAQSRQRSRSLAGATEGSESSLSQTSSAFTRSNSPSTSPKAQRPIHETPRMQKKSSPTPTPDDDLRTTSGAGVKPERRESSPGRRRTSSLPGHEPDPVDVKAKLKRLSAFKKKRARRRLTSPGDRTLSENSEPVQELLDRISEGSQVSDSSDESSNSVDSAASDAEEQKVADDRQKKLDRLIRKTSNADDPNAPNPARDAFNRGYKLYKDGKLEEALKQFSLARRFTDDGLYKTFYAFTQFQLDESQAADSIKLLEEVIESKHRQASADAHLFLGHILKAGGNVNKAQKHYQDALRLNPKSREAEREVRLAKMRKKSRPGNHSDGDETDSLLKKIFKK